MNALYKFYNYWSLVNTQAKLSLKAEASRLYLSYLWWLIEPVLFVLVFYFVFEMLLGYGREDYLLFLMCGKIPFLWFSKSVTSASNSIVQNRGLIGQVDISKAVFPYISVQESLYKQLVVFIVLLLIVISYGYPLTWNWVWLIPVISVQYLLILLCSLMGALLVSYIQDFRLIIALAITFLMFSSGIFWDVNTVSPSIKTYVLIFNPLAYLIDAYRQVLMYQSVYSLNHMAGLAGSLLFLIVCMHLIFSKLSRKIAGQVLSV